MVALAVVLAPAVPLPALVRAALVQAVLAQVHPAAQALRQPALRLPVPAEEAVPALMNTPNGQRRIGKVVTTITPMPVTACNTRACCIKQIGTLTLCLVVTHPGH